MFRQATVVLRSDVLTNGRPDQFAPTERAEVYLNTRFSNRYVPVILVHKKETSSLLICHPHDPKTALRVEEFL
jgi:hypothetical protein